MNKIIFYILLIILQLSNALYLPCVNINENCYYQPCCKPNICYEETICINNITKI